MKSVLDHLEERGLLDAVSSNDLKKQLSEGKKIRVYCGFDPTADSLHVGNLVALQGLKWFQKFGHIPYAIIGGATGLIGDPSGRSIERPDLSEAEIEINLAGIRKNVEKVLRAEGDEPQAVVLNNYDWFKNFGYIGFLRDIGKYFRMGVMLSKEAVKARLQSEEGLSYTELSYQLLQGYDFYHLHKQYGVEVQIGGSDQWGNITAGMDLVHKLDGKEVHAVTLQLLLKSDGTKFGKSEKGAVWLTEEKLSAYEFYQYFVRQADSDVIRLLKMLTMIPMEEIQKLELSMKADGYVPNTVQKVLAREITKAVHGPEAVIKAEAVTKLAQPGHMSDLSVQALEQLHSEIGSAPLPKVDIVGKSLVELIVLANILPSKSEVRRLIRNGGLSLNNQKITDEHQILMARDCIGDRFLLISLGKKNRALIELC